jgi:hypothetical protein
MQLITFNDHLWPDQRNRQLIIGRDLLESLAAQLE